MATRRYFRKVPQTEHEWRDVATAAGVANSNLNSMQELRSGSKTTQKQFLLYRTICLEIQLPEMFDAANFNLTQNLIRARTMLAASVEFQDYLVAVGTNQSGNVNRFEAVLDQQREVLRGLDNRHDPLKKHDESLVNASFVLFSADNTQSRPYPKQKVATAENCPPCRLQDTCPAETRDNWPSIYRDHGRTIARHHDRQD